MDLVKIMETFPTQEDCIAYLERLRWRGSPECPHCRGEVSEDAMNTIQDELDVGIVMHVEQRSR